MIAVVVATTKGTYIPYRGPWEVETWVRERMLDGINGRRRFHRADGSMVELQVSGWAVRSTRPARPAPQKSPLR